MIGILNYGLGNIQAFKNICIRKNFGFKEVKNSLDLENIDCFLLPGVGAFDDAINKLKSQDYFSDLNYLITKKKKPVLGVCVGMQIMFRKSQEGKLDGLNWIDGEVKIIGKNRKNEKDLILPHLGWNKIEIIKDHEIFKKLNDKYFYFLHSYFCETFSDQNFANTNYYHTFTSVAINDNIYGIQFHPEKSHQQGEQILTNYYNIYVKN